MAAIFYRRQYVDHDGDNSTDDNNKMIFLKKKHNRNLKKISKKYNVCFRFGDYPEQIQFARENVCVVHSVQVSSTFLFSIE